MEINLKEKKLRVLNENGIQNLLIQQKYDETSLQNWPEMAESLDSSDNQIEEISLQKMTKLKRLCLKRNNLKNIHGIPTNLIELDLSHNMFSQLSFMAPGADAGFISKLALLERLEVLDLSNNKLTFLEINTFSKNLKLKVLNLSNNFLKSGLKAFLNLAELENLDLSSNSFEDLNSFSLFNGKLPKLSCLNLKNNPCIIKNQSKYVSLLLKVFPNLVKLNDTITKRIECTPSKTRKNYSIDKSSSSKNTPQKNYSAYKTVRKRSSSIQFNNFPPKILDLNLSSVKNNIESTTSCKSLYNNLDHILDDNENSGSKSDNNRFCTPRSFAWESSTMKDHINTFITMLHNNNTPSKKNFSKDNADIHITTIEPLILPEKIDTEVQTDAEDSSMSVSKTVTFDLNTKGGGEQFLIQEQNRLLRDYHNQLEAYRKKIESLEKRDEERKKNIEQFKKILLFFAEDAIDSGSNSNKGGNQNQFEMNALIEMLLSRLEKQSNDFDDIIQMQQVNRNSLLSTLNHAEEELDCSISKLKKDIASMRESILIQNKKIDAIILSRIEDFKRASAQLEASKSL